MSTSHNCSSKGSLSKGCLAIFLLNGNRSDRSELQEEATLWRELRIHKSGQMFDWRQVWRHHFPGTLKLQSKVLDDDVFIPRSIQSAHISGLSLRLLSQICPRKRDNVVCQILLGSYLECHSHVRIDVGNVVPCQLSSFVHLKIQFHLPKMMKWRLFWYNVFLVKI